MDPGLVVLGVIVLFGAGLLFKTTGFMGGEGEKGEAPPRAAPFPKTTYTEPTLPFESPSTLRRAEFRICRNCFSENNINAEYCSSCGRKLIRPKDLKVSETQRKWFRQFNWTHNPFTPEIIPNLFTGYKPQIEEIMKKLSLRSGNITVLGDVGTGKTTLLRWLELNLPDSFHPIYVFRPPDRFSELIDVVAYSLDPSKGVKPGEYNIYNIDKLVQRVGKNVVILLDEAHELDLSLNKSLKNLGDIENVSLVLAGLPPFEEKLRTDGALYDRIVSKVELSNLSSEESKELIAKRIENVGGWGNEPFTDDAIDEIYVLSSGNPRRIIHLCDSALTEATSEGILSIDRPLIDRVSRGKVPLDVVRTEKISFTKPSEAAAGVEKKEKPKDLKGIVEDRIRKIDRLYSEYAASKDDNGMKEVVGVVESTIAESKKHLEDKSLSPQERERFTLMVKLFEDWLERKTKKRGVEG